jgi:hypothetical protein
MELTTMVRGIGSIAISSIILITPASPADLSIPLWASNGMVTAVLDSQNARTKFEALAFPYAPELLSTVSPSPSLITALLQVIKEGDEQSKVNAIKVITAWRPDDKDGELSKSLIIALDGNYEVKDAAAKALGVLKTRDRDAIAKTFLKMTLDENSFNAVAAFAKLNPRDEDGTIVNELLEALTDFMEINTGQRMGSAQSIQTRS